MYRKILYGTERGVARITLNRPEKRNALDAEMISEMKSALKHAAADEGTRVVLLTGSGNDFCSGADLDALAQISRAGVLENMADARNLADLFVAIRNHPRPVVASVCGRALAGGCGLATACDITLAAESARFGYPEVNIGFIPAMVMAILRRSVSEKTAFELITMGEIIPAPRALQIGLIHRTIPDAYFEEETEAYIVSLAAKSASAVGMAKSLLYHMDTMSFEAAIAAGVQANAIARATDDCKRGIEQFLKRS
jgi:methylglutaconyl-CoA hydratase